jgi:cytoskeleton protein RodZ
MKDSSHQEEPMATTETGSTGSVGDFLHQERLRQNKTLKEVAEATCIHVNTIQALEENNRGKLPAEVFVRGFLTIYAQYLGLDVQETLNRYGRQTASEWVSPETIAMLPGEKSRPFRHLPLILIMICLAGLLAYGGYRLLATPAAGQQENGESLVQEKVADAEVSTVTPAPAYDLAETETGPTPSAIQEEAEGWPQEAEDQTDARETSAVGKTARLETVAAPAPPIPAAAPAISAAIDPPAPIPAAGDAKYVLTAEFTEATWLQIRIDGREPVEYLFQPGERQSWHARERISLFLGNAGGVDLVLNGQRQPKPGQSGRPARISFPRS